MASDDALSALVASRLQEWRVKQWAPWSQQRRLQ